MGAGMVWSLTRRSELLRCKNLSMKSRMYNHSSGSSATVTEREGAAGIPWGGRGGRYVSSPGLLYCCILMK